MIWAIVIIVAALLQTTWLTALSIRGVQPELVLVLVVYFAIADNEDWAMWTGALGGIFTDVATSARLGHHTLCYVIVGYILGRICRRLITDSPAVKAFLVMLGAVLKGLLFVFVANLMDPGFAATRAFTDEIIPAAFYTAVVAPILFVFMDRVFRRRSASASGVV